MQQVRQQDVLSLSRIESIRINTFGAYLKFLRERQGWSQAELAESLESIFTDEENTSPFVITADMYKKMERGRRAPQFDELLPMYSALRDLGIHLNLQESKNYVRLARLKIESLRSKKPKPRPDSEWRLLEIQLTQFNGVQAPEPTGTIQTRATRFNYDVSHIVGREEWLEKLLELVHSDKKFVTIMGMMGVGKTSLMKLLLQRLLEHGGYYPVMYTFSTSAGEDITPSDHLRSFLASILAELQASDAEAAETVPIATLIKQMMQRLVEIKQRVILLVDDGQVVLERDGQLSSEWQQFLSEYLGTNHQALMCWCTREWPLWTGRERSFVVDGDETILPPLEPRAGVAIWQRLGFSDVPENLLQQATQKCGGNPLMIELRSASIQRPRFSIWKSDRKAQNPSTSVNEHQKLIEQLLANSQMFTSIDTEVSQLLQQVVSRRLSRDALQILELLSISAISLPFPLLAEVNPQSAEYAFGELLRNSLIDREAVSNERAALLPLVREAGMHMLKEDRARIEEQLSNLYEIWLTAPDFLDEQEEGALVTELLALYIKQGRLRRAAELLITHGWLSTLFGTIPRLRRLFDASVTASWRTNPEEEVGAILLRWQLAQRAGEKIDDSQQYQAYQHVIELTNVNEIQLQPATEVHLAHHLMLRPMREKRFTDAHQIIDEVSRRIMQESVQAEDRASLFSSKARLLARWGEYEESNHPDVGARLRTECIETLAESIALWRESQIGASPLQERYINFRLARTLNDYAYRLRLNNLLDQAERAMEECLELKEKGATIPKSHAISLSEFSQILLTRGKIREALAANDKALAILNRLIEEGNTAARADKGMVLCERGDILLQQARLEEAENCFLQGRDLTGERAARKAYHALAQKRLEWIGEQKQRQIRYQPDRALFALYAELVAYDDISWLVQSGPLDASEEKELAMLLQRPNDSEAVARSEQIILQSRHRELSLSKEEGREPRLRYPKIPQKEVAVLISGFESLKASLDGRETNAVRRNLYHDAIDEHLARLHLFAAIAANDIDTVQRLNTLLYGHITAEEMGIALQVVFATLEEARNHTLASPFAEELRRDLKRWGLHPGDFLQYGSTLPQNHFQLAAQPFQEEGKLFSAHTLKRYFQFIFTSHFPQSDMRVFVDTTRGNASIDVNIGSLALADRLYSTEKARQLLAEEVGIHFLRSEAGRLSPLALLASGTARYSSTEEGLAKRYVELINAQLYGRLPKNQWLGTLAVGLMAGIISPALTFSKLNAFLAKLFLVRNLLSGKFKNISDAQNAAEQEAVKRALRTARTATDLSVPGLCSFKDRIYLKGYLDVCRFLENGGSEEQLYVGKMGVEQVEAMQELHILHPSLPLLNLAFDPDLEKHIMEFEKE